MKKMNTQKGIYLLPNLLTSLGLFSGLYALISGTQGRFEAAAVAIFIALVIDGLDGRIARLTNTQSEFGAQFDSLSDMVAFGIAPAVMMYLWVLEPLQKIGWVAVFLYSAAAALRLARFNIKAASMDRRYFQGLPSPVAAATLAGMVWCANSFDIDVSLIRWPAAVVTIFLGALMVSNIRYHSFKDIAWQGKVSFTAISGIVILFILISSDPPLMLFGISFIYMLSGPILTIRRVGLIKKLRKQKRKP